MPLCGGKVSTAALCNVRQLPEGTAACKVHQDRGRPESKALQVLEGCANRMGSHLLSASIGYSPFIDIFFAADNDMKLSA